MKKTIKNLKTLLDCKNQSELSKILGVSTVTISRTANDQGGKQFKQMCEVLECALNELPAKNLSNCRDNLKFMFG
jgi:hypothetical protein